ncbi:MAG TPA: tyrosine-type recombinase/integrase [Pyrinomonadaceae bacterium]|nr:tyrosine-type recombinase/integrase [Pyrinomonadaceae bacterium]
MPDQVLLKRTLTIEPPESPASRHIDARTASAFCERSVSEETRRAYRRVVREFFRFNRERPLGEITSQDVQRWRDHLITEKKSASTVAFKLSIVRSLFDYLQAGGYVTRNPALSKLVPPPAIPEDLRGRALTAKEVRYLLSGPDREQATGARDYALLLLMLRTSIRVSEACGLRLSQVKWSHGRWVIKFKVKGGRERTQPIPGEVKKAIDEYLHIDRTRRSLQHSDGPEQFIFQPHTNYRTLEFNKPLSATMAWQIVRKWGGFTGVGKLSPHDLRRTAITRALDQGLSYRQVQMMSGHRDPKTVMRYDHGRENMSLNAANFLNYEES